MNFISRPITIFYLYFSDFFTLCHYVITLYIMYYTKHILNVWLLSLSYIEVHVVSLVILLIRLIFIVFILVRDIIASTSVCKIITNTFISTLLVSFDELFYRFFVFWTARNWKYTLFYHRNNGGVVSCFTTSALCLRFLERQLCKWAYCNRSICGFIMRLASSRSFR